MIGETVKYSHGTKAQDVTRRNGGRGGVRGRGWLRGLREAEGGCGKLKEAVWKHICLYKGDQICLAGQLTNKQTEVFHVSPLVLADPKYESAKISQSDTKWRTIFLEEQSTFSESDQGSRDGWCPQ